MNKFLKHDFEKVHRCLELHGAYYFRCHDGDEESNDSRYSDEDKLSDKLEKGLATLQKVDFILAVLYSENVIELRQFIVAQFKEQGYDFKEVGETLDEYKKMLADNGSSEADDIACIRNGDNMTLHDKIHALHTEWKSLIVDCE